MVLSPSTFGPQKFLTDLIMMIHASYLVNNTYTYYSVNTVQTADYSNLLMFRIVTVRCLYELVGQKVYSWPLSHSKQKVDSIKLTVHSTPLIAFQPDAIRGVDSTIYWEWRMGGGGRGGGAAP